MVIPASANTPQITEFAVPSADGVPGGIAVTSDGAVWSTSGTAHAVRGHRKLPTRGHEIPH
jgi:streptogramin lyase